VKGSVKRFSDRLTQPLTAISSFRIAALVCLTCVLWTACNRNEKAVPTDHPRLTPNVVMHDITFSSAALSRDMQYRVVLPASPRAGTKLPVVYLLHGGGGNFRDWSNYSDVARFAQHGLILVMPEGDDSYYTNSAERPKDRYEDYIANDLISDVEARFPAATGRSNRAVVGISMGGFGAVKLALRHPELFTFAGGLSSAIDVPTRPFSIKRVQQWRHHSSIFGPCGSSTRQRSVCACPVGRSGQNSLPFSNLWRTGGPVAGKPQLCSVACPAAFWIRVPHDSRRPRLEPVERMAGRLFSKPAGTLRPQRLMKLRLGPARRVFPHLLL